MIPPEKSDAVSHALQQAFGTTAIEDLRAMPKGLSSDLIFRFVVGASPYLLRIMTRIDESMDPRRIFASMSAAAEAGLAPAVRYSNAQDGISIVDAVEAVPLPEKHALVHLPRTLRKLHALPIFPKAFNHVTAHNGFVWRFRKARLLPQLELEEVFTRYEHLCAIYPRIDADIVSCHNDLKPENILFDGYRLWLTGWQAALANDRFFDLAIPANFLVFDNAEELTYLEQYFGQPPDEYQRARFFLMRQILHLFYAAVFLLLGAAGKPLPAIELLSFSELHRVLWQGELDLTTNDAKLAYGMVHWRQLVQNLREARWEEALHLVSVRHPNPDSRTRLLPSSP